MYYKSSIALSKELKMLETEELEMKVINAAEKVRKEPGIFIIPFLFEKNSIHVAYKVRKDMFAIFYAFLQELGLEESKFSREKITFHEYDEKKTEAYNCGYISYSTRKVKKLSPSLIEKVVEELDIPEKEVAMPGKTEYPITLKREIERIKNDSLPFPVIYYIVSESSNRREAMREALIYSLKENGRVTNPHYFNLHLEKRYDGYDSNWSLVDALYGKAKDSAVVFSLSLDSPISSYDKEAEDFATRMAKHQDRCITIIESDRYAENFVEIINKECKDSRFILIEDPGYTKEDLRIIARGCKDDDLYIDYKYVFKMINNSTQRYYDESYVYEFVRHIYEMERYDDLKEEQKKVYDSFINSIYLKKYYSPIDTLKEEPIFEGAKAIIKDIIREHDFLEERKLRGLEPEIKPLYREKYNAWRRYYYEITTELPSLNMIFYGDRGTGKERTAELYRGVLKQFGLIVKDSFKCITKGEVISKNPKETVRIVKKTLEGNKGGVVYIDWGERGLSEEENEEENFILDSIIRLMDEYKRKLVVILSISEKNMKDHVSSNTALLSSVPYILHFPSLSTDELWTYFSFLVSKEGYICSRGVKDKVKQALENMKAREKDAGRISVRKIFEIAKMNMARRLSTSLIHSLPDSAFNTLKAQDFDNLHQLD